MAEFFSQYNGVELFFLSCAAIEGFFVLMRFVLLLVGMDHGANGDMGAGAPDIDGHHIDSDVGFKLLSLQGVTSFLMMFGLVGMALYNQSKMGIAVSMTGAIVAGLGSVWIIAKMFSVKPSTRLNWNV